MTTSPNMAALLGLIPSFAALFTARIFDIEHPCYGQVTPVKNKVSADQCHVTILNLELIELLFFKLTTDHALILDWIAGSCLINL